MVSRGREWQCSLKRRMRKQRCSCHSFSGYAPPDRTRTGSLRFPLQATESVANPLGLSHTGRKERRRFHERGRRCVVVGYRVPWRSSLHPSCTISDPVLKPKRCGNVPPPTTTLRGCAVTMPRANYRCPARTPVPGGERFCDVHRCFGEEMTIRDVGWVCVQYCRLCRLCGLSRRDDCVCAPVWCGAAHSASARSS